MKINNKKILVTGGAGFIGSHIVDALVKKGARVKIYDNFSSGLMVYLNESKRDVEIVRGDILNYSKLNQAVKGSDFVIHQAAQLEVARCIDDPIWDLETNTIGSLNVFKSCVANRVQKVVWASSAGVYGQMEKCPQREITHPTNPNWQYGVSKLAVEKYARIFNEMYKIPIASLRYAIVYGPREWWGRVLSVFLKKALEGKPLVIFGDGHQTRDFVDVDDIVNLNLLALEKNYRNHLVLNGSTNRATSVSQLAEVIKASLGLEVPVVYDKKTKEGDMSKEIGRIRLPSELKAMQMSYDRAKRLLGWRPKISLREGIKKEFTWLKENPKLWKKIKI